MRNFALLGFSFVLLVVQSALAARVSFHPFTPNLLLPIVIYLGVQQDVQLVRGAAIAFLLGFALDEFCGSPIGLFTFVMVATFMAARGAGIRLFLRGTLFQAGLVFLAAMLAGGTVLALRAIFSRAEPFPLEMPPGGGAGDVVESFRSDGEPVSLIGNVVGVAVTLVGSSAATALFARPIFAAVRRLDSMRARRRDAEAVPGT